ncbi:MAG: DUF5916 domain-containing protein [Bacteroidota bacterium]
MNKCRLFLYLTVLLLGFEFDEALAQTRNEPGLGLAITKAKGIIVADGVLDEEDWKTAAVATNFFLNYPVDSLAPTFQSEARLTFNDHFFYISFVCYDDNKPDVMQSLRRDFEWPLNDNIGIYMDPYNDFTNGFFFSITPYGVQSEGIMSGGGSDRENSYNNSWDNKWYSKVKRYEDKWIAELAIPLKSFRYNQHVKEWNVTFVRKDLKRNQTSSWIATPIQFIPASFAYSGKLLWQENPPHAGTNISSIPYTVASSTKDSENGEPVKNTVNAGFDAKVSITPSLNLDLTVNPDFSTVEVDRQVINLTRFEFQFPERRQFFLENSDLFSAPGFPSLTQPFFSRRIGLAQDSTDDLVKVPILYGARISGKIGSKWRIGAMDLQTKSSKGLGLPEQNYAVGVLQRQVFSRSNFDIFFVNKQSIGLGEYDSSKYYHEDLVKQVWNGSDTVTQLNTFSRVAGADFNLLTKNNRWTGKAYYHRSFDNYSEGDNFSHGGFMAYTSRVINSGAGYIGLGKNYNAEAGFVPNRAVYPGNYGSRVFTDIKLYPKSGPLVLMMPGFVLFGSMLPDGTKTDRNLMLNYAASFRSTAMLLVTVSDIYQKLPSDFDILDPVGDSVLLKGQEFRWKEFNLKYTSNARSTFTYSIISSGGEFYNGKRAQLAGTIGYRVQPYGSLSLTVDYNDIRLPDAYGSAKFLLISPRLDFTFTDKLFLTTFVQYNDRYDNVNLNARFQWRYKPASDFFIVYTENYFPGNLITKNRALVVKFTYWFNL